MKGEEENKTKSVRKLEVTKIRKQLGQKEKVENGKKLNLKKMGAENER